MKRVEYKLSKSQLVCLAEALGRYQKFGEKKPLTVAWTGLGTQSEYDCVFPEHMTYAASVSPRHDMWWKLTPKGAAIVQFWMDMGFTHNHISGAYLPPVSSDKLTEMVAKRLKLCVRINAAEKMPGVQARLSELDRKAVYDPQSNPVTFWVTTDVMLDSLMSIPNVVDAIYSR